MCSRDYIWSTGRIWNSKSHRELDLALKGLLDTVQQSIGISRNFIYIVAGFAVTVLTLVFLQLPAVVFAITAVTAGLIFLYKTCEFVKNRYCDRDIRIVLIYKIALFHLLEESCLQEEQHEL